MSTKGYLLLVTISLIVLLSLVGGIVHAYMWEGGLTSSKVVGGSGSSILVLGGNPLGILNIGSAPRVSTLNAIKVEMNGGTHATLRGSIDDMYGWDSSNVWFEWGYDTGYGTITSSQVATLKGVYSESISGFDPDKIVYCRFIAKSEEGTNYGLPQSFMVGGGLVPTSYRLTQLFPYIWVGVVILAVWGMTTLGVPLIWTIIVGGILIFLLGVGVDLIIRALTSWW